MELAVIGSIAGAIVWIMLVILSGVIGSNRNCGAVFPILLSIFLCPLVGLCVALMSSPAVDHAALARQNALAQRRMMHQQQMAIAHQNALAHQRMMQQQQMNAIAQHNALQQQNALHRQQLESLAAQMAYQQRMSQQPQQPFVNQVDARTATAINLTVASSPDSQHGTPISVADELIKLTKLRAMEALTEDEFEDMKRKLLERDEAVSSPPGSKRRLTRKSVYEVDGEVVETVDALDESPPRFASRLPQSQRSPRLPEKGWQSAFDSLSSADGELSSGN